MGECILFKTKSSGFNTITISGSINNYLNPGNPNQYKSTTKNWDLIIYKDGTYEKSGTWTASTSNGNYGSNSSSKGTTSIVSVTIN